MEEVCDGDIECPGGDDETQCGRYMWSIMEILVADDTLGTPDLNCSQLAKMKKSIPGMSLP